MVEHKPYVLPVGDDLTHASDHEILALWVTAMKELRRRGIIRSDNTPTGDYAEWLVARSLGLTLAGNAMAGYDAIGPDKARYQIKARRLVTPKTSRQLSPLRKLDQNPFDYVIVVLFGPEFDVQECWQIPIDVVREYAVYREHVNGHILYASGAALADGRTTRLKLIGPAIEGVG